MAYSQSKKLTAQEKKLLALRTQLYGKEQPDISKARADALKPQKALQHSAFKFNPLGQNETVPSANHNEFSYLKNDLQKIGILATLIFSAQALLYIAIQKGFTFGGL